MTQVLLTGAEGFIGSHLTEMLIRQGYRVRSSVMYNFMNSRGWLDQIPKDVAKECEVLDGDIRDQGFVQKAVRGVDAVIHLAALIGIPYSYTAPRSYIDTNVVGTLNLLLAARDAQVQNFIQTSTSEVYGSAQYIPMDERHPLNAQSPYAASKLAADQMAFSFYCSFNTPVTILRPFNTYGPRQSRRAVIPTIITQLLVPDAPVRLGSLHPMRDFTYVDDTAKAFINCIGNERAVGETINLGTGVGFTVGEVVHMIAGDIGREVRLEYDSQRVRPALSEVDRLVSDNSKAIDLLGWRPKFTGTNGFQEGLRRTVAWFRDQDTANHFVQNNYVI